MIKKRLTEYWVSLNHPQDPSVFFQCFCSKELIRHRRMSQFPTSKVLAVEEVHKTDNRNDDSENSEKKLKDISKKLMNKH